MKEVEGKKAKYSNLQEVLIITKEVYYLPKTWSKDTIIDAIHDGTIGTSRVPMKRNTEKSIVLKSVTYQVPKHENNGDEDTGS